jgi:hypothetical protein
MNQLENLVKSFKICFFLVFFNQRCATEIAMMCIGIDFDIPCHNYTLLETLPICDIYGF